MGKITFGFSVKLYSHGKPKTTILASVGCGGNKMKKIENIRLVLPSPFQPPAGICLGAAILFLFLFLRELGNYRDRQTDRQVDGYCVCLYICRTASHRPTSPASSPKKETGIGNRSISGLVDGGAYTSEARS